MSCYFLYLVALDIIMQVKKSRRPEAAPLVARRSGRNTRAAHGAKSPSVPKRHPQMVQSPAKPKAAVPTPHGVVDGGLMSYRVR